MPSLLKTPLFALAAVLLAVLCHAADPTVLPSPGKAVGVVESSVVGKRWLVLGEGNAPVAPWRIESIVKDGVEVGSRMTFEAVPGKYTAIQIPADEDTPLVVVPVPLGGTPDDPKPDEPDTDPTPAPQPTVGPLRALLMYETTANLSRDQLQLVNSTAVRQYLKDHCEKSSDGVAEWRFWDDDFTADHIALAGPKWASLYDLAKRECRANTPDANQPWLLIEQKGVKVHSSQVNSEADALRILKQFGGE